MGKGGGRVDDAKTAAAATPLPGVVLSRRSEAPDCRRPELPLLPSERAGRRGLMPHRFTISQAAPASSFARSALLLRQLYRYDWPSRLVAAGPLRRLPPLLPRLFFPPLFFPPFIFPALPPSVSREELVRCMGFLGSGFFVFLAFLTRVYPLLTRCLVT